MECERIDVRALENGGVDFNDEPMECCSSSSLKASHPPAKYSDPATIVPPKSLSELITRLHDIFASDDISVEYVQKLMASYKGNPREWKKFAKFDKFRYTRNLVDEGNGKFNLMILCWNEAQGSSIHSHANSHCFLKVLDGSVKEEMFCWPQKTDHTDVTANDDNSNGHDDSSKDQGMQKWAENQLLKDECGYINDDIGLHRVENPSHIDKAVTLHLYSPPFDECECFDERTGKHTTSKVTFWSKYGKRTPFMCRLSVLIVTAAVLIVPSLSIDLGTQWKEFKATYNKNYKNLEEELYRHAIWKAALDHIALHNAAYQRGEVTYYLGENEFADMRNEEFVKIMTKYQMPNETEGSGSLTSADIGGSPLPDSVDWRKYGYVTPVRKQGPCAAGYAFATVGAIEGLMYRRFKKGRSLSPQNIIDCSGNHGCLGGSVTQSYKYVISNRGIDTDEGYPYEAEYLRSCRFDRSQVGGYIKGFETIKRYDEFGLQEAVAKMGPVAVAIDASHIDFQLYKGGVYSNALCNKVVVNHAALVTGYGNCPTGAYWMVKNR
ncbi:cysteine dioxygenase [Plakobranchus ocellatus]|uniref:cysteine dioxygenase n=1 Tax=Plakobranchus ocellatus TaxID=259542 RepID=A0AAV4CYR8_9GAST|nr:cysteine dioxygenase [Plakobranchus ocellatus]